jgi:DnaD-like protein
MANPKLVAVPPVGAKGASQSRSVGARWKHPELFQSGFVAVPVSFLRLYSRLKPFSLTPGEAMFVLHLMQFKWDEKAPFPGYKTLAGQMGISHKMARTHARSLEIKKLLRREMRVGQTNRFDLGPLFDALAKATQQEAKRAKRLKAKPGWAIVE